MSVVYWSFGFLLHKFLQGHFGLCLVSVSNPSFPPINSVIYDTVQGREKKTRQKNQY